MTRRLVRFALALGCLLALPAAARAQSTIGGTVKDTSGAVLPGVTVEVSSPALIEGPKATTTDGGGQYRIVDLRPGMYTVKFSLTGFTTVERPAVPAAVRLQRQNRRRDEGRRAGRDHHGHRRGADRGRAERGARGRARSRRDRQHSDRQDHSGPRPADSRRLAERARRGRLGRRDADLHVDARRLGVGGEQHRHGRRHGHQRPDARRRGADLHQRRQLPGNDVSDGRHRRRALGRRRDAEHGAERRRQPLQRRRRVRPTARAACRATTTPIASRRGACRSTRTATRPSTASSASPTSTFTEGGPIQKDKLWFFVSARDFQPINTVPNTFLDDGTPGLDDNYIRNAECAPDLPGEPAAQVLGLLRARLQVARPRHGRVRRSGNGRHRLDVAELLDDVGEVHGHAEQQAARRRRLLAERRVLPQPVRSPGIDKERGHARSGTRRRSHTSCRAAAPALAPTGTRPAVPGQPGVPGLGVVRDRPAPRQGGLLAAEPASSATAATAMPTSRRAIRRSRAIERELQRVLPDDDAVGRPTSARCSRR